jgi:NAD(P)-dependent dehydrogenase (short-subunit alcohol dehydrogenase family)
MGMGSQTIVITGASDGIGAAAARTMKARGENIVLVGRDPKKTAAVAAELHAPHHVADYAELDQVRALAADLDANYPQIDVLANNAGGMMGPRTVTPDGFEKTFQVNHLAGFLLTSLLLPKLTASNAKVIQTASQSAKNFGDFDIDDLQNANSYGPLTAYSNGKLANILFTRELHRRYAGQGIAAAAFHPGIVGSNFANDTTHVTRFLYHTPVVKNLFTISPEKGAEQLVWLAGGTPGTDWQSGTYYEKKQPARSLPEAHDDELATRLWDESARMVQVRA